MLADRYCSCSPASEVLCDMGAYALHADHPHRFWMVVFMRAAAAFTELDFDCFAALQKIFVFA